MTKREMWEAAVQAALVGGRSGVDAVLAADEVARANEERWPERTPVYHALTDYERKCAAQGNAIMAIKAIRERLDMSLKEAKDYFERHR